MKILVISNLFPPHILGGYEILCGQVCDALTRRGHDVTVLTSDHGTDGGAPREDSLGVRRALKLYAPFDMPAGLMRARRLRAGRFNYRVTAEEIAARTPDVIFMWSQLRLTVAPARAAEDSPAAVAYTFNDENILGYLPGPFGLRPRKLARWLIENLLIPGVTLKGLRFDHATCISRTLRDRLLARGLPAQEIKVIYQGIPIADFPLKPRPGSIHSPARLLYAGQLHPWKGVHTLIEAAGRIAEARGRGAAAVTVVGGGPQDYVAELERDAAACGAAVEFRGRVPHHELPTIYRDHDVFVFPSTWPEPFGLTHLEAMASGTPVVSTAAGGQAEFLDHGRNALIFEKEDAAGLAARVWELMDSAGLRERLAAAGRATVEERFTLDRYVTELEAFLQEAAT